MQFWHDDNIHLEAAVSLYQILQLKVIFYLIYCIQTMEPRYATKIYYSVIDLMKLFTKREMDNLYSDVLTSSLTYFTQE